MKNSGLTTEFSYLYTTQDGKCKGRSNITATIKQYDDLPVNKEAALMKAVANQPVSVAVDGHMTFEFYSGGVMIGSCGTGLDRGIAAIGYTTPVPPSPLVKNGYHHYFGGVGFKSW